MKNETQKLIHLTGKQAYRLYWEQVYKCRPRLSTVMAIDLNLEIIIDEEGKLLAFRYDLPVDMKKMVLNVGHWQIFNKGNHSPEVLVKVRIMMGRFRRR